MTIQIKPLTQVNKDQWQALWQGYLTFYKTSLSQQVTDNTWQNILAANQIHGFGAFLANDSNVADESTDELVGIVHIVIHPNTWNDTDCVYLEDLYVNEQARGMGAGRALIEHVYGFAQTHNCNRVYWVTNEDNHTARKLYDKLATKTDMVQYRFDVE